MVGVISPKDRRLRHDRGDCCCQVRTGTHEACPISKCGLERPRSPEEAPPVLAVRCSVAVGVDFPEAVSIETRAAARVRLRIGVALK